MPEKNSACGSLGGAFYGFGKCIVGRKDQMTRALGCKLRSQRSIKNTGNANRIHLSGRWCDIGVIFDGGGSPFDATGRKRVWGAISW